MADRLCEGCLRKRAIVGWGRPARWLCFRCFDDALADARRLLDQAREMFS